MGPLLSVLPRSPSTAVSREIFLNGFGYITPPDENLFRATLHLHRASQSLNQRALKQAVTSLGALARPEMLENLFELF